MLVEEFGRLKDGVRDLGSTSYEVGIKLTVWQRGKHKVRMVLESILE